MLSSHASPGPHRVQVLTYMVLFAAFLLIYGFSMYTVVPHRNGEAPFERVPQFNSMGGAINSLVHVSLLGESIETG